MARELAPRFAARASGHDRDESFPTDDYIDLRQGRLLGLRIPRRYGGEEVDSFTYVRVLEEISAGSAATALTLNMHSSATAVIATLGSDSQCERWLRPVVEDGETFGSLTSEPNVSLRKARFSTMATRVEEGYLLNGFKYFASLAGAASSYFVFAAEEGHTEESPRHALGLLVRASHPGVEVVPSWDAMGMRATSSHSVKFENCLIPKDDVVTIDLDLHGNVTDLYMFGYGAVFLGIAEAGYRLAVEYAKAKTFGPDKVSIAHYPSIQRNVAEMTVKLEAMRGLVYRAAREADGATPKRRAQLLLQAKWAGAMAGRDVNELALQIVGGAGFSRKMPLERYIRDARAGVVMPPNLDACLETIGQLALDLEPAGGFFGSR